MSKKNFNDTIGNQTGDLPACSAVSYYGKNGSCGVNLCLNIRGSCTTNMAAVHFFETLLSLVTVAPSFSSDNLSY